MMPKVEFGHLYKFAASLGLAVMALGCALPWLVVRQVQPLLIKSRDLRELTPGAQRTLLELQSQQEWVVGHYRYASGGLLLAGSCMLVFGFIKWRKRQMVLDETEDVQRDTAKATLNQMTPSEVIEQQAQEAEEFASDMQREAARSSADESSHPQEGDGPSGTESSEGVVAPTTLPPRAQMLQRVQFAEESATKALVRAFQGTHLIRSNVVAESSAGSRMEVDVLLASSTRAFPNYVVEIKPAIGSPNTIRRLPDWIARTARVANLVRPTMTGEVRGLLLVLVQASGRPQLELDLWRRRAEVHTKEVREAYRVPVDVLILTQEELAAMSPSQLRVAIASLRDNDSGGATEDAV